MSERSTQLTKKVTLCILTLNRSEFVARFLRYFADEGFKGVVLIGDSSESDHFERTEQVVRELAGRLNVVLVKLPARGFNHAIASILPMIETPYAVYMGDDDLLVPAAINSCVAFLDANPDYVGAHGKARGFVTEDDGANGKMTVIGVYPIRAIEEETALTRFATHMIQYSVQIFGVHRAEAWQAMWENTGRMDDRAFGGELLPTCLSPVLGKIKKLDELYLLRQSHQGIYTLPGRLDWLESPAWGQSYRIFVDRIAAEIAERDSIELSKAEAEVKKWFHFWMFTDHHSWMTRLRRFKWRLGLKIGAIATKVEAASPVFAGVARAIVRALFFLLNLVNVIKHGHNFVIAVERWLSKWRANANDRKTYDRMSMVRRLTEESTGGSDALQNK